MAPIHEKLYKGDELARLTWPPISRALLGWSG